MGVPRLLKIGAVSALSWIVIGAAVNLLHPLLPQDPASSMRLIAQTRGWEAMHGLLLCGYLALVPFGVALRASFRQPPWILRLGMPLLYIAVTLGVVQVATHPTVLLEAARSYVRAPDEASRAAPLLVYRAVWGFNIVLELAQLLLFYTFIVMVGAAMCGDAAHPKWLGVSGIIAALIAAAAAVVGMVLYQGCPCGTQITFLWGLLPLAVWTLVVAWRLWRMRPPDER